MATQMAFDQLGVGGWKKKTNWKAKGSTHARIGQERKANKF
jgi:hypothetical protein